VIEDETTDPALVSKAIEYYQKAGKQAAQSPVNSEAIKIVAQLERLPATSERAGQELRLQLAPSGPLMTTGQRHSGCRRMTSVNTALQSAATPVSPSISCCGCLTLRDNGIASHAPEGVCTKTQH
jgi:hypothetical protein